MAIGDEILDLFIISHLFNGPLLSEKQNVFRQEYLNDFMALGRKFWIEARSTLQNLLSINNNILQDEPLRSKYDFANTT